MKVNLNDVRGVYSLFNELLEEDIRGMKAFFEAKDLEFLLSVAMMRFAHGSPIKRMQRLHHYDYYSLFWCKNTLKDRGITDIPRYVSEN